MSTFPGPLKELPNISIDCFDSYNHSSTVFFLSHCHTDHMRGLNSEFHEVLKNRNLKLYCNPISKMILLNNNMGLPVDNIVELTIPTVVTVPESVNNPSYEVTVTPIPAGHCPGSIMFLFETLKERVLYTGDFRFAIGDVKKVKSFHNGKAVKIFDKIYFDSTFFTPNFYKFSNRSDVTMEIINKIQMWWQSHPNHDVVLHPSANYSNEYLYIELFRAFKMKAHVKNETYKLFWNIPEIGCAVTNDCSATKLHIKLRSLTECCDLSRPYLYIKTSAQRFKSKKEDAYPVMKIENDLIGYYCYATHSSYSEIKDFLSYLKPKNLEACTDTFTLDKNDQTRLIKKLQNSWLNIKDVEKSSDKVIKHSFHSSDSISISIPPSTNLLEENELLESPPSKKRMKVKDF